MSHRRMSLREAIRESATNRPALSSGPIEWELVPGGIRPLRRAAVDCAASGLDSDNPCHEKPEWVIETIDGYLPTCLTHSGMVLNWLLSKEENSSEVAMYFHPYKGV